ncbi:basic proline-rich protein-like [Meles meles]|uniref:basic proline-rich protein-like n=1 Tax=Meles meles TaxID=9662 RepID=UPI001E69874C|nr:basic proline-rich protein-like [Meles meles]
MPALLFKAATPWTGATEMPTPTPAPDSSEEAQCPRKSPLHLSPGRRRPFRSPPEPRGLALGGTGHHVPGAPRSPVKGGGSGTSPGSESQPGARLCRPRHVRRGGGDRPPSSKPRPVLRCPEVGTGPSAGAPGSRLLPPAAEDSGASVRGRRMARGGLQLNSRATPTPGAHLERLTEEPDSQPHTWPRAAASPRHCGAAERGPKASVKPRSREWGREVCTWPCTGGRALAAPTSGTRRPRRSLAGSAAQGYAAGRPGAAAGEHRRAPGAPRLPGTLPAGPSLLPDDPHRAPAAAHTHPLPDRPPRPRTAARGLQAPAGAGRGPGSGPSAPTPAGPRTSRKKPFPPPGGPASRAAAARPPLPSAPGPHPLARQGPRRRREPPASPFLTPRRPSPPPPPALPAAAAIFSPRRERSAGRRGRRGSRKAGLPHPRRRPPPVPECGPTAAGPSPPPGGRDATHRGSQASGVPQPFPRSSAEWAGGRGRRRSPRLRARRAGRALSSAPARKEEAPAPPARPRSADPRPPRPPGELPAARAGFVATGQGRRSSATSRALQVLLDSGPPPLLPARTTASQRLRGQGGRSLARKGKGGLAEGHSPPLDVLQSGRRPRPVPRPATDGPRGTVRTARLCPAGRSSS